jgi:hypothetical protein
VFSIVYFEHPRTLIEANVDPRVVWPGVEAAMGPLPDGSFEVEEEPARSGAIAAL